MPEILKQNHSRQNKKSYIHISHFSFIGSRILIIISFCGRWSDNTGNKTLALYVGALNEYHFLLGITNDSWSIEPFKVWPKTCPPSWKKKKRGEEAEEIIHKARLYCFYNQIKSDKFSYLNPQQSLTCWGHVWINYHCFNFLEFRISLIFLSATGWIMVFKSLYVEALTECFRMWLYLEDSKR